jgi:surface antigen/uncharacterized protein YukE
MDSEAVKAMAKRISDTCNILDDKLNSLFTQLQSISWEGSASDEFKSSSYMLNKKISNSIVDGLNLSISVNQEVDQWLATDQTFTNRFLNIGEQRQLIAAGLITGTSGAVLGTTTGVNAADVNYTEMGWSARFNEAEEIQERLASTEAELDHIPEQREEVLKTVDENIAYWEAKKEEMEKLARNPLNKIPTNLKGDSASDIYKEEVQRCDEVLASLKEQKELYSSDSYWDEKTGGLESKISDLKLQQTELNGIIQKGIKQDGPTTGIKLAGCAKYVSEKRDLSDMMVPGESDACQWDDNALKAGYEVGDRPIPGSVMVMEPENGFMTVDSSAGHVVYVEEVKPVEGGYEITYSQANTPTDSSGNWNGKYEYTNVRKSTRVIADGTQGVSFIYEKP